jgi:diguanylate cyclase (GGDEF)-like protein
LAVTIDRLRLYERAEHAANHDLLTGLPNYRFLQERLATMRVDLENGRRSAVLMVDMDGLKLYNDALGHDAGDRAIQRVAEELRAAVRGEDLVARTGGDEFVVVMEGVSQEEALAVSQRMHESLRGIHHEFGNAPVPVRISVGLAFAPEDGTGASELLEAADRAMYAAKFSGGDRTRATTGDLDAEVTPRAMRRRGSRIMELLNRAAIDGASGPERLAVALAQRYVIAVAIGRGIRVDSTDPLRMLVSAEASHHIEAPEGYRDQETALLLLDGLRAQWENQVDAADLQLSYLQRVAAKEGTGDLDAYIAAEAWLPGKMGRYFALVALGWVPEPPWILLSDTLPSSPENVRESWASYVLSTWQDGDASKIPFARRQEMAYEVVDSVFARYQESIETPSKYFWRFFEAMAGNYEARGARGLLDVVNATVIANPEAVTEVITGSDVSRPRAEEICRATLISAREEARKTMINAFFPAFIQPLLGIGNDYILYEDGVSAEEVVSQLQEREQTRLAEED